jgi:hypothetical protein
VGPEHRQVHRRREGARGRVLRRILDATFTYTDDTVASSADRASSNRQLLQIVTLWAPIGLAVLGLILIAIAIVLASRRGGRHSSPAAVASASSGPKPVKTSS